MPEIGAPRVYENAYAFTVEINGITVAEFEKCSALNRKVDIISRREGGRLFPRKTPGLADWEPITLERGAVANDSDFYDWSSEVVNASTNKGLLSDAYKRDLDIVLRDRDLSVLKRWRLFNTWPSDYTAGAWDNSTSAHTMEIVVLAFDRAERVID